MVPTARLLLDQVPPEVVSDRVVVKPVQTSNVPLIGAGIGFTVTTIVAMHPVGKM